MIKIDSLESLIEAIKLIQEKGRGYDSVISGKMTDDGGEINFKFKLKNNELYNRIPGTK